MKIIRPSNCSDSHFISVIIFWISARICNVVNPGNFPLELHPLFLDSTQFSVLTWIHESINLLLPYFDWIWTDSSHTQWWIGKDADFWSIVIPEISCWSLINFSVTLISCLKISLQLNFDGMWILCIIFPKMNCSLKGKEPQHSHIIAFTSRFSILFSGLRSSLSGTFERTFSRCEPQALDVWRLCGHIVPIPSMSEFPNATIFLVLFRFSWKSRSSWSFSAATSLLVLLSISASFCHTWELDAASWLGSLVTGCPFTLPILLTGCPECPRTFLCNWTLHSRRTCRSMRDQVQRRLWLCHNCLFSFLFLHPFRHRFRAAGRAEILRAANWAEMADVKQMEKIVPLITCEIALCQKVCELVFGVDIWFESLDPD